jgi:hypothetical protein
MLYKFMPSLPWCVLNLCLKKESIPATHWNISFHQELFNFDNFWIFSGKCMVILLVENKQLSKLVLLWAQLTKIYPPLPTSVQPISITKTLLIVPTKNERDPPLFTGKLLIKFQNILRNTTQVIIRHRVKIQFSVISSPITQEWQKWKPSKMKGILLSSPVSCW